MQDEAYIRIPLRRRDGSIRAEAIVDPDNAHLAEYNWHWDNGYAVRNSPRGERADRQSRAIRMHRVVLGLPHMGPPQVDHINRNRLDNRRSNLRVVSVGQNNQNVPSMGGSSRHRGVAWDRSKQRWRAYATLDGSRYWLGCYVDELEAAATASAFRAAFMPYAVERPPEV